MRPSRPDTGSKRDFNRQQYLSGRNIPLPGALARLLALMVLAVVTNGCTVILKPPEQDPAARAIVQGQLDEKDFVQAFKAIGNLQLVRDGKIRRSKVALAIQRPGMLRMEIVSFLGQPIARIAARDGHLYFQDLGAGDNKIKVLKGRNLKRLLGMELAVNDLVAVLRGRLPEPEMARRAIAVMDRWSNAVLLKDKRHYLLARISWGRTTDLPAAYQRYGRDGKLLYQIRWTEWKKIAGSQVPSAWIFADDNGNRLELELQRIYLQAHMPDEMFILKNNH